MTCRSSIGVVWVIHRHFEETVDPLTHDHGSNKVWVNITLYNQQGKVVNHVCKQSKESLPYQGKSHGSNVINHIETL